MVNLEAVLNYAIQLSQDLHLASRSTLPSLPETKAPLLFQTSVYVHNGCFSQNTKKQTNRLTKQE